MSVDSSQHHPWPSSVLTSIRPALVSRILNVHFCLSKTVNLSILMLLLQCLFSIQPPLHFTPVNYLSSISSTLASQIIAQNEPFPSLFPTATHCLNVTSLSIRSARLSPPVRNNQARNYENISRKDRQRVCFIFVSLSLDICLRRPMSFTVIPRWKSALN